MTRYNLQEASLLDVSGELGPKARSHLHSHLQRNPLARAEYQQLQSDFAILCSLPMQQLPESAQKHMSNDAKCGIRRKLREIKRHKNAGIRRRFILGALASVSGIAACVLVTLQISTTIHNREQNRLQAVAHAEDSLRDFINADSENMTDVALASLNVEINNANDLQQQWNPVESSGNRLKLLDLIDTTNDENLSEPRPGT